MTLSIRNNAVYSPDGERLKDIFCPLKINQTDLEKRSDSHFDCIGCKEVVVNTNFISEDELVALLREAPETCLFINLANPMFEVAD